MTTWRWLLWRAGAVIVRTPAYWTAAALHALSLAAFLLLWGDGVPTIEGSVLAQLSAIQTTVLAVLLPWTAARCDSRPRDMMIKAAVIAGLVPSRLVLARAAGLAVALGTCALTGLPVLLLAQQISALPATDVALLMPPLAGMVAFVAVLTAWCDVLIGDRVAAWVLSAGATLAIVALVAPPWRTPAFAALAIAGAGAMAGPADYWLRYLPERRPQAVR